MSFLVILLGQTLFTYSLPNTLKLLLVLTALKNQFTKHSVDFSHSKSKINSSTAEPKAIPLIAQQCQTKTNGSFIFST